MPLTDITQPLSPLNLTAPSRIPRLKPIAGVATPPDGSNASLGPSVMPTLPATLRPIVTTPRLMQEQMLQQKIQSGEVPDPAKPGFWHHLGHIAARIGNVAGDAFAPGVMMMTPGTQLNRALDLAGERKELAGLRAQDLNEQQSFAKQSLEGAQAGVAQETANEMPGKTAAANAALNARSKLVNAQADLYDQASSALQDPQIRTAFSTLSNTKATPQQRREAMSTISQSPIGMLPMLRGELSGAEDLYREGELGSRVGGKNIVQDPSSPTGYATLQYDRFGTPIGLLPVEPSAEGQLLLGPQGGTLAGIESSLAGSKAAATQAQRLVPVTDPETNRIIGYTAEGGVASLTGAGQSGIADALAGGATQKPGTTVLEQAQNAVSLQNMIRDNIVPQIDVASNAGVMGPVSGRVQEWLKNHVGDPNPVAARLAAQLEAVPMMLGRMYGFRSAEYVQGKERFLNTRMTPQALKGYLSGVVTHAKTIADQGGMGVRGAAHTSTFTVPEGAPAAPQENGKFLYSDGRPVAKSENGKWVAP